MNPGTRILLAAVLAVLGSVHLLAAPACAIVVGDDPNNHVITPPSDYDGVCYQYMADGTTGVLISPWFVLTADHASYVSGVVRFDLESGSTNRTIMEKHDDPNGADLAVVRLNRSVGLDGYALYDPNTLGSETGKEGILLGYGMSGTPATVQAGGDPNYPRGTLRIGYNKIDGSTYDPNAGYYIWSDFDPPSAHGSSGSLGIDKEASSALGDSGGPVFVESGGTLYVAGIQFSVSAADPNHWPKYGDYSYYVQLSRYSNWIGSVIPSQPATKTGDFDSNHLVDANDIEDLYDHYSGSDMWYDVSGDGWVGTPDTDKLIRVYLGTEYGDADLDGKVDANDYNILAAHFGLTGSGRWDLGDFNNDDNVDFADYQIMEVYFGFGTGGSPPMPPMPIPEPAALSLLACGAGLLARRRSRSG